MVRVVRAIKPDEQAELVHALDARRMELGWLMESSEEKRIYAARHLTLVHRMLRRRLFPTRN